MISKSLSNRLNIKLIGDKLYLFTNGIINNKIKQKIPTPTGNIYDFKKNDNRDRIRNMKEPPTILYPSKYTLLF